jgi:hypothetical protein
MRCALLLLVADRRQHADKVCGTLFAGYMCVVVLTLGLVDFVGYL